MQQSGTSAQQNGLPMAFMTYLIWGLLPLYLRLVHHVPPFEFVGWRVVFTVPVCLVLVLALGQWRALKAALAWPVLRRARHRAARAAGLPHLALGRVR